VHRIDGPRVLAQQRAGGRHQLLQLVRRGDGMDDEVEPVVAAVPRRIRRVGQAQRSRTVSVSGADMPPPNRIAATEAARRQRCWSIISSARAGSTG
jgi:hypothetical protein